MSPSRDLDCSRLAATGLSSMGYVCVSITLMRTGIRFVEGTSFTSKYAVKRSNLTVIRSDSGLNSWRNLNIAVAIMLKWVNRNPRCQL